MKKLRKAVLTKPLATVHPLVVEKIKTNLVTWFSMFTIFDLSKSDEVPAPIEPPSIYPGSVFTHRTGPLCVVDHWGCFNEFPLLYIAPVVADPEKLCPLDVEISSQFLDLFSKKNFILTDDLFLLEREEISQPSAVPQVLLRYGLVRKISRALVLKFGPTALLL